VHPLERKDFVRRERRATVEGDTQYTFLHVLVRDVAYGQIPRSRRAQKHRLAAEWIESLGRPEDHADLLAHHYLAALELAGAAGTDMSDLAPRAAGALGEAADRALALNAFSAAARYYERSLSLTADDDPGRPWRLLRHSRALHRLISGDDVIASAAEALVAAGDLDGAAEAELMLADVAWHRGEPERSRTHFDRAVSLVEDAPASPMKARVLSEVSRYRMLEGADEEAVEIGRKAIAMAENLELELVLAHALNNVGTAEARLGDEEGYRQLERSIELTEQLNSPDVARGYTNLGAVLIELGDVREGVKVWRRGAASTARFGDYGMSRWLQHVVSMAPRFVEGDWDELLLYVEDVLARAAHYQQVIAYNFRGRIRLGRGDIDGAKEDAAAALRLQPREPQALVPALSFGTLAYQAAGRAQEANALADRLLAHPASRRSVPHTMSPWFDLSWALVDLGRTDDLVAAIDRVERRTRWVEAAEATARGDYAGAAGIYAEAGNDAAQAYAGLRAAQAGQPGARLEQAIAFFRKAGATAYLAEAEALVAASA
jgi:tetratricopeptide (TPR) repeat protein